MIFVLMQPIWAGKGQRRVGPKGSGTLSLVFTHPDDLALRGLIVPAGDMINLCAAVELAFEAGAPVLDVLGVIEKVKIAP